MKKVLIIGAGIAGLTAGIYARLCGFDVQIVEQHNLPGGQCTGWDRKGYHFDGCIHWLVGSKKGTPLHRIWRDTGALDDSVVTTTYKAFVRCEDGSRSVTIFTDADVLEEHLLGTSPPDAQRIRRLCRDIRALRGFSLPVQKPLDMLTPAEGLRYAFSNRRALSVIARHNKITVEQYANCFKDPLIGKALRSMMVPNSYKATALLFTLASMNDGDSGYPIGGSRAFARRMAQRFAKLGGQIRFGTSAKQVIVENGRAHGIKLTNGEIMTADYVVSCADGHATLFDMLGGQYLPQAYKKLFADTRQYALPTSAMVYLGVDADLSGEPHVLSLSLNPPLELAGRRRDFLQIINYSGKGDMAPAGKTVLCCFFEADYDDWSDLRNVQYAEAKKRLAESCVALVEKRYPHLCRRIEVTDVVTPQTYVRYCGSWRGAWMTWGFGRSVPPFFSGELPGLDRFLMAGMWTLPPGGLPCAAAAGKFAVQRLCANEGFAFTSGADSG